MDIKYILGTFCTSSCSVPQSAAIVLFNGVGHPQNFLFHFSPSSVLGALLLLVVRCAYSRDCLSIKQCFELLFQSSHNYFCLFCVLQVSAAPWLALWRDLCHSLCLRRLPARRWPRPFGTALNTFAFRHGRTVQAYPGLIIPVYTRI